MNEWAIRRKRIIFYSVLGFLIFVVGVPSYLLFYEAPTCFDGRQNGDETGADCGGSCQLICPVESLPLITRGDPRVVDLGNGTYEAVAVVRNPNVTAEAMSARYTLSLFSSKSLSPIRTVEGEAYIPANSEFVVLEGPFSSSDELPTRAILEWQKDTLVWQKTTKTKPLLAVEDVVLVEGEKPRITARLKNNSTEVVRDVEVSAVVSGGDGSVITATKTFVEVINSGDTAPLVFVWPTAFELKEDVCGYPVDVALVIDRSGSMDDLGGTPPEPLATVKETARYFVDRLGDNNIYTLVSFADEASDPIDAALGADRSDISKAIEDISILTSGVQNTNIGAGILGAIDELNSDRRRARADRALVLLTDGEPTLPTRSDDPNYPLTYAREAADLARADGISIFTIGLGDMVDTEFLKSLATTSAEAYFAPTAEDLESIYRQIATKICKAEPAVIDMYTRVLPDRSSLR